MATLLLGSCYSYRAIDLEKEPFEIGNRYKIYDNKGKKLTGKLGGLKSGELQLKSSAGKRKQISISEVKSVKKGKFSVLKAVGIPVVSLGVVFGLALWVWPGPEIAPINFTY